MNERMNASFVIIGIFRACCSQSSPGQETSLQMLVSLPVPSQGSPSQLTSGSSQTRNLDWTPDPQLTGQTVQSLQTDHVAEFVWQSSILQLTTSVSDPEQLSPPPLGGGWEQERWRTRWPMEQVRLQSLHELHVLQTPSTAAEKQSRSEERR